MVVVLVLSVLAMLAVPGVARLQRRAKTATIMNDFRVFATAFETYAHETGSWPAAWHHHKHGKMVAHDLAWENVREVARTSQTWK